VIARDELAPAPPGAPVGIYAHVPFCAHICPYCDFNTYAGQSSLIPRYVEALCREIEHRAAEIAGRGIATVFLGGGTPSLLAPAQVADLIAACRQAGTLLPEAEITLEANPNGLDAALLAGYREAGVNRLSIGVQTMSPRGLRRLGRLHEPGDATAAFAAAREAGFDNLSADFIFGWPGQTPAAWDLDLDAMLGDALVPGGIEHVSLYSLIVEPGTPLADAVARAIVTVPDDDASADLYERAIERMGAAGWFHYEVANWARTPASMSRHNRIYWRNADFIGAGAGAHGTVAGRRWMNQPLPLTYITALETGVSPEANREEIDARTAMGETMMLGLRLLEEGVNEEAFEIRHGAPIDTVFGEILDDLAALGMIERGSGRVRLSPRGLLLANDVCARFL
jgi:oxygen-independent coproporphyrinogen III oxidase